MYNPSMAVHYETESPPALRSSTGPYRDTDYQALPDEPRCELLYGSLFVTPAPSLRHQDVVFRLARLLVDHADQAGDRAFVSPVDVRLADHSVVQPEVVYIKADRDEILRRRVEGAPDLVVEVLSPATARRDLGEKMRLYAESGIAEYWLVDPEAKTFEFLVLRDGAYAVLLPEDGVYRSPTLDGLQLDLEAFWRSVRF